MARSPVRRVQPVVCQCRRHHREVLCAHQSRALFEVEIEVLIDPFVDHPALRSR